MEKFLRSGLFFAGFVFLMVLSLLGVILAKERIFPYRPTQETTLPITAEGKVTARPDVGQVTFTVMTEGNDSGIVEIENAKKVNAIVGFLKDRGVKDEDLKTSQFSLQPKYYYPYNYPRIPCPEIRGKPIPCPPPGPVVVGYVLYQGLTVKIRNLEIAGAIVAGAIERGATNVGSLVFSVEDMDVYKKEAREKAFLKAKAQAEELARLGGFRIGKVLSIQEGWSLPRPYAVGGAEVMPAPAEKGGPSLPPQIEAGSQEVAVTLTVVFKIDN